MVVIYRNSIQTRSNTQESLLPGNSQSYDFTNSIVKAYGNNLINVNISPVLFVIFSGEVNHDGFMDLTDLTVIFIALNTYQLLLRFLTLTLYL